jgi:hypothetical protein
LRDLRTRGGTYIDDSPVAPATGLAFSAARTLGEAMADILLLFPPDKSAAAGRLAEAIRADGYRLDLKEVSQGNLAAVLAAEASVAAALLLIWSRPLVSHDGAGETLAEVRRHANLIEVSADGIEPPAPGEDSPVVLLSGWRGQPFHPGWQKIQAQLARLAGPATAAAAPPRTRANSDPAPPAAAGPPRAGTRRRGAIAAIAAAALLATGLGATSFFARGGPEARQAAAVTPPAPPPAPSAAALAPPREGAAPAAPDAGAPPQPLATAPAAAAPAGPSPIQADPAREAPAATAKVRPRPAAERSTAAAPRPTPPARLKAAAPKARESATKRYSRKNSKTMRRFCQRSGRGTPQCRVFLRSTQAPRR